ncbi:YncE family protein [Pontibaca methylaminivorans]|nr:YncE family protein [Pontibaca methylaminivorans]
MTDHLHPLEQESSTMTSVGRHARHLALGLLLAGGLFAAEAGAQTAFSTLDRSTEAQIRFSASEQGKPILAGSEVTFTGQGFQPGQKVKLLYGTTPLSDEALTADGEGQIEGRLTIPEEAAFGTYPIIVVAEEPYYATVADLKVSPEVPLSGQDDFAVDEATGIARGLYQSAYSAGNDALFVTSSIGRPPVRESEIVKLDPETFEVLARISPAAVPGADDAGEGDTGGPSVFAVYGIALDDAKDTLWVTNTRQDTVAVYQQSDLSLVKQFDPGTVTHARDVRIDSGAGRAYVSATGTPEVVVFDTETLEPVTTIEIKALGRGQQFSAASLSLDPEAKRLYVASLSTDEVAVIDTETNTVEKVFPVPGARSAIGVSHDPETGRIFVAAQGSDNLVVLDGDSGAVIADTSVGAGALNVAFDPVNRLAYVSNRGAGTIAVTDPDGNIVANLGPAPLANHVALGKDGTVYAVDNSSGPGGEDSDTILRIRPQE